jgi:hypothetical protein
MKTNFDGLDLDEQAQLPHEDLLKRSINRYKYATKMSFEDPKLFSKLIKNKISPSLTLENIFSQSDFWVVFSKRQFRQFQKKSKLFRHYDFRQAYTESISLFTSSFYSQFLIHNS